MAYDLPWRKYERLVVFSDGKASLVAVLMGMGVWGGRQLLKCEVENGAWTAYIDETTGQGFFDPDCKEEFSGGALLSVIHINDLPEGVRKAGYNTVLAAADEYCSGNVGMSRMRLWAARKLAALTRAASRLKKACKAFYEVLRGTGVVVPARNLEARSWGGLEYEAEREDGDEDIPF